MGGQRALQLVARGGADEFPRLFGEQLIHRLGIFSFNSLAGKNDRPTIDVSSRETSLTISCLDEPAERVCVDTALRKKWREQDRRAPDNLPAGDYKAAGKRLCLPLQSDSCEQQMGGRAANIDAHRVHLDGFLAPDGLRYLFPLGIRDVTVLEKIVMHRQSRGRIAIQLHVQHEES